MKLTKNVGLCDELADTAELEDLYTRTAAMLGEEGVLRLRGARVAVIGVGGVGGFAAEALARAGVGHITVLDSDRVAPSNINRQIIATQKTVGMLKVDAIKQRIVDINPDIEVKTLPIFYNEETETELSISDFDYILDCIDSTRSKLLLIKRATSAGVPIISSMGAGNKLDPTRFRVADISKTHTDPLAKVIRTELKRCGISHLKTVWSDEPPVHVGSRTPASVSFVPSVVGLIMAGEVIKHIALQDRAN